MHRRAIDFGRGAGSECICECDCAMVFYGRGWEMGFGGMRTLRLCLMGGSGGGGVFLEVRRFLEDS